MLVLKPRHTNLVPCNNASGETNGARLPTLNELRARLVATGRPDLSWADVSDLLEPDASVLTSKKWLLVDMEPTFDAVDWTNPTIVAGRVTLSNLLTFINISNFSVKEGLAPDRHAAVNEALLQSVGNNCIVGKGLPDGA